MDVCRPEDFKEVFIKLDEAIDSESRSGNSDFSDDIKDLNDFLGILWKLNIQYDTVDELKEKLKLDYLSDFVLMDRAREP
jgi:hypothetical protein